MVNILNALYGWLLRLYPARFRDEFGDEMLEVFAQTLEEAAWNGRQAIFRAGLREVRQAPALLFRVHAQNLLRSGTGWVQQAWYASPPPLSLDGRSSWGQAGLELALFVSIGLAQVAFTYAAPGALNLNWTQDLTGLGLASLLLPAPLFLFGLRRGLPRWAYPPVGMLLGFGFLTALRYSLLPFFLALVGLSLALVVLAARTHSRVRPMPSFFQVMAARVRQDWSGLSFALFGMLPLLISLAYDDAHTNNRTPYLALSVLAMILAAFVYIRSRKSVWQFASLAAGAVLVVSLAALDQAALGGEWLTLTQIAGWRLELLSVFLALLLAPLAVHLVQKKATPSAG